MNNRRRHAAENVSKKQLREEMLVPEVSVVPMVAKQSIRDFLLTKFSSIVLAV